MQYDENAEKYGYEGEMTPLKCDELNVYKGDVYIPVYGSIADAQVYLKKDVDAAIAELKADVNNALIQNQELCQALQVMYSAEEYMELQDENAELKQKLEDAKDTAYAESVDAGIRERRLKRALWLARAERAEAEHAHWATIWFCNTKISLNINKSSISQDPYKSNTFRNASEWRNMWCNIASKCLKKAKEYK